MRKSWTQEEEDLVRAHYLDGGTVAVLKLLPHRTHNAVRIRAARLGLTVCERWSENDYRKLRWTWATVPIAKVAKSLGRTPAAVYRKAQELGLKFGRQPGYETIRGASKRLGFSTDTLVRILHEAGRHLKPSLTAVTAGTIFRKYSVNTRDVDEAVAAWLATENVGHAARARGLCDVSLRGWLIAAGHVPRGHGKQWRLPTSVIDQVIRDRAERMTGKETVNKAAKRVGFPHSTIQRWLIEDGHRQPAKREPWFVDPAIVDAIVERKRSEKCQKPKQSTPSPSSPQSSAPKASSETSSVSPEPRSKRSVRRAQTETASNSERRDSTAA